MLDVGETENVVDVVEMPELVDTEVVSEEQVVLLPLYRVTEYGEVPALVQVTVSVID